MPGRAGNGAGAKSALLTLAPTIWTPAQTPETCARTTRDSQRAFVEAARGTAVKSSSASLRQTSTTQAPLTTRSRIRTLTSSTASPPKHIKAPTTTSTLVPTGPFRQRTMSLPSVPWFSLRRSAMDTTSSTAGRTLSSHLRSRYPFPACRESLTPSWSQPGIKPRSLWTESRSTRISGPFPAGVCLARTSWPAPSGPLTRTSAKGPSSMS